MRQVLMIMIVVFTLASCTSSPQSDPTSAADVALRAWAQQSAIPFRNPAYQVVSNDGTFAQVQILTELRRNADEPWIERETTIECRNLNSVWQCSDVIVFDFEDISQRAAEATGVTIEATSEAIEQQTTRTLATATAEMAGFIEQSSGLIAFVEFFEKDRTVIFSQLYTYNTDQDVITKVLEAEGPISGLSWSPNGQRLAFSLTRDSTNSGIYVADVASGETIQVSQVGEEVWAPRWSPDGTKLVYSPAMGGPIMVINADGSDYRELTVNSEESFAKPEWSPDQTSVSFVGGGSPTALHFVDTDGTNIRTLPLDFAPYVQQTEDLGILSHTWSPTGSHLLLTTVSYSDGPVYKSFLFDLGTEELLPLQQADESFWAQGWSQDSALLFGHFYQTARQEGIGFYSLSADGANATFLGSGYNLVDPREPWNCKISPDGFQLLLTDEIGRPVIFGLEDKEATDFDNILSGREELNQEIYEAMQQIGENEENLRVYTYYTCWSPE